MTTLGLLISFFIYSIPVHAQAVPVIQPKSALEIETISISKDGTIGTITKEKIDCSDASARPEIKDAIVYVNGNKISSSEFGKINESAESIWTDNLATCSAISVLSKTDIYLGHNLAGAQDLLQSTKAILDRSISDKSSPKNIVFTLSLGDSEFNKFYEPQYKSAICFSGQQYTDSKILIIKSHKNLQLLDANKIEKLQTDSLIIQRQIDGVIIYLFERKLGNGKSVSMLIEYNIEKQKFALQ